MGAAPDTSRISPTAHYTGYVWAANGLSMPALATSRGRLLYGVLRPANAALRALGASSLEDALLARHRVLDHLLCEAIEAGRVGQVVEVAAGLSPRGALLSARHPGCRYVEGDLPAMAASKRARLERAGCTQDNLEVVELDALAEGGPASLDAVLAGLDPALGTAVVTEGLVNYFPEDAVRGIWRRVAAGLRRFPHGLYLSDLHTADDARRVLGARPFRRALSVFARGAVHFPFATGADAVAALEDAGFASATAEHAGDRAATLPVEPPRRSAFVRVVVATTS